MKQLSDFKWPLEIKHGNGKCPIYQWEFQDPKMEVPTIYKAYVSEYPHKMWSYMVQYLHFRILKFPLNLVDFP